MPKYFKQAADAEAPLARALQHAAVWRHVHG